MTRIKVQKLDEKLQSTAKRQSKLKRANLNSLILRKRANSEGKQDLSKDFKKELCKDHILQCISGICHLIKEQLKDKNDLLAKDAQPIFIQVTCIRVPKVPGRQMKILLPHSIVSSSDEVALFVCDLKRGRRKDYEPTVEHYRELLDRHRCTCINEIIPINRVKTEFDQFELKRKLVASYDHFLVDGRIAGHISHILGGQFFKKRKLPIPIRMQSKDLKHEIDYALRKTSMRLHSYGDSHTVQIGNTSMDENEILKNILAVCNDLSKNYPGGWDNIRSIRLKSTTSLALPIYMTLKNKNAIKPPVVRPKRPKAYHDVKGELSTFISDTQVIVKPEGDIILEKKRAKKDADVSGV